MKLLNYCIIGFILFSIILILVTFFLGLSDEFYVIKSIVSLVIIVGLFVNYNINFNLGLLIISITVLIIFFLHYVYGRNPFSSKIIIGGIIAMVFLLYKGKWE